jgi:hypothetical protein
MKYVVSYFPLPTPHAHSTSSQLSSSNPALTL